MPLDDTVRMWHMLESAQKALAFTRGKSRADLDTDEILSLALIRLLEIIGEAARAVTPAQKNATPSIPWAQINAARNRLIHAYFSINFDIVWGIIQNDLPPLVAALQAILPPLPPR